VTDRTSLASIKLMRLVLFFPALAIVAILTGCAESASAPDNTASSNAVSLPQKADASDNPPVTMSGYVDTSTTVQVK
jgi:hypothetical protein